MAFFKVDEGLNKSEFKELFEIYFEQVKRFVYYKSGDEDLASDITQEVFLKIWERRKKVRKETVVPLLYTIAGNLFVNKWRKTKVALKFIERSVSQVSLDARTPETDYAYQETKRNYEQILSKMPQRQREVFLMSRIDELKYEEIANNLQISIKAVEKRMQKALEMLRAELVS